MAFCGSRTRQPECFVLALRIATSRFASLASSASPVQSLPRPRKSEGETGHWKRWAFLLAALLAGIATSGRAPICTTSPRSGCSRSRLWAMPCPSCRHRALGLLAWLGHSLWQPRWKENRWEVKCRSCKATLAPSSRDRILRLALPLTAIFVSFGVASQFPPAYRPYGIVHGVIGLVVGMLVHYPMARYDCLDTVPLPEARGKDREAK